MRNLWMLLLSAALGVSLARGAEPAKSPGAERFRQRLAELAEEMKLTEEQRMQMRDLWEAQAEELRELRANTELSPEQKAQKFKALQQKMDSEMKRILNEQQYIIWKDEREKIQAAISSQIGEQMRTRMEGLFAELNLTDEQKKKLREVFASHGEKLKELRANTELLPEQKAQQFKELQEKMEPQIKAILTPEQFTKWQQKREEMRERFLKARQRP